MHSSTRHARVFGAGLAAGLLLCARSVTGASAPAPSELNVAADDIGGTVTSARGPQAGVWVIAETRDFQTRFAKIVVTDSAGRYLVPHLPQARYSLWVRGYGLADSPTVDAAPGQHVDLTAVIAADAAAAAKTYPAAYWYAMMRIPEEAQVAKLPGGRNGYLMWMKNMGCIGCHQLGNLATRTIPKSLGHVQVLAGGLAAARAVGAGRHLRCSTSCRVRSPASRFSISRIGPTALRQAKLPAAAPARPSGIERNVVATVRDWSDGKAYVHDLSGTDRRNPTVNANGPLYGAPELSTDDFPVLDPKHNRATTFKAPVRDADTPTTHDDPVLAPSAYWGEERIWDSRAVAHNPMLDRSGRVWYTARIRAADNPPFCKHGSTHAVRDGLPHRPIAAPAGGV